VTAAKGDPVRGSADEAVDETERLLLDATRIRLISDVPLGALDSFSVSASALGNGGPAFGITGPFASFAPLGDISKVTMIGLMWLGRLEIIPVVVLFTRHYWRL